MEVIVLRLPQVTGFYDPAMINDYCLAQTQQYLIRGTLTCHPGRKHFAMLYNDAVEAVMDLMAVPEGKDKKIYQLQGVSFTEKQFAGALIKLGWNKKAQIEEVNEAAELENETPRSEIILRTDEDDLAFSVRYGLYDIVRRLCKASAKYHKEEEQKVESRFRILPFIEAIAGAVLVTFLTILISNTWVGEGISLFMIYVVLFGAVYGTAYGLFAGVLATAGMFVVKMGTDGFVGTLENYTFFLCFLEFVLIGVIAGYMHDKFKRKNTILEEDKTYLSTEVNDLTTINDNNIYIKNAYEKRLVRYENSLARIYEMTSQLDMMEPHKLIFQTAKVTADIMGVDDVAVYFSAQNDDFFRLLAATSKTAMQCGKSLRYDEDSFMFRNFEQREIYKNSSMQEGLPTFAGGVFQDDRINAIVMIWTKDLRKINLYESNMFALLCRLIEKSMDRAELYDNSIKRDNYINDTDVLNEDAYTLIKATYKEGRKQNMVEYTELAADPAYHELSDFGNYVRETDVLGLKEGRVYILLPFSTSEEAEIVVRRYESHGIYAEIVKEDKDKTTGE